MRSIDEIAELYYADRDPQFMGDEDDLDDTAFEISSEAERLVDIYKNKEFSDIKQFIKEGYKVISNWSDLENTGYEFSNYRLEALEELYEILRKVEE